MIRTKYRVMAAATAGLTIVVAALSGTGLASATEPLPYNCAVQASPSAGYKEEMKCFTFFDQAVAYASGGSVDASPWRWDPRGAAYSPQFTNSVNNSDSVRRIYSIEFEHPDYRGYALVVWGNGDCAPSSEKVVRNLGQNPNRWWTDKIDSFVPYNGCFSEHFDDSNLQGLIGGSNTPSAQINRPNRTNSLSITGGLSDEESQMDCDSGRGKCAYTPTARVEYVPSDWKDELISWNCTAVPQAVRFSQTFTRSSTFRWGVESTTTVGTPATAPMKVEQSLKLTFGGDFGSSVSKLYDASQTITPGSVGIISSAVSTKKATGLWNLDYENRKWYHHFWDKTMTASQVDKDSAMNVVFNQRLMTAGERANFCSQSDVGTSEVK
ncbi:hypothetical protein OTB20_40315 [Streptomyces sp. H27-H1]|uniref:hypothetical protein n=1 Tax=Streptomyces sp. H27-H1 TaxID=2996461 RepID=UPI00226E046C|nr:hypothetical protein [Streptomyces sp. H27-H1]MCY0932293.1 hypothetical protein [Streptomyces sp. H27-H1]